MSSGKSVKFYYVKYDKDGNVVLQAFQTENVYECVCV